MPDANENRLPLPALTKLLKDCLEKDNYDYSAPPKGDLSEKGYWERERKIPSSIKEEALLIYKTIMAMPYGFWHLRDNFTKDPGLAQKLMTVLFSEATMKHPVWNEEHSFWKESPPKYKELPPFPNL